MASPKSQWNTTRTTSRFRIDAVVISSQHAETISTEELRADILKHVIQAALPANMLDADTKYHINPTGRFVIGGPMGDTGLTGRKIIVDTYGGMGRHGGGAFSGKDPTKVDRSACYMARYIAKNIVAAGLADRCEVQLAYAIGVAEPVSVLVDTFGTAKVDEAKIADLVRANFKLTPKGIIESLNLRRPIYRKTAAYGHFGRNDPDFTWERPTRLRPCASRRGWPKSPSRRQQGYEVTFDQWGARNRAPLSVSQFLPVVELPPASAATRSVPACHSKLKLEIQKREHMSTTTTRTAGDIANLELADMGKKRIDWANQSMKVLQIIRKEFIKNQPLDGHADFGLPARHRRDGQPGDHAARWRRRRCAVRLQPAVHPGRCRGLPGARLQHPGLRHQGRGQRHVLLAHHGGARSQAAHHDGRWR